MKLIWFWIIVRDSATVFLRTDLFLLYLIIWAWKMTRYMIKIPNSSFFMPIPICMVNFIRNHFTKQRKIVERPRVILQLYYMQVTMRIRCVVSPLCVWNQLLALKLISKLCNLISFIYAWCVFQSMLPNSDTKNGTRLKTITRKN